jgi:hypothetical protein
MFSIDYIKEWSESYKTDLTTNIMPFWLKYGLDKVNGGIYTCVDRNGSLMDTTKSVWFQGRFAFICSYAYNNIEKNFIIGVGDSHQISDGRPYEQTANNKPFAVHAVAHHSGYRAHTAIYPKKDSHQSPKIGS